MTRQIITTPAGERMVVLEEAEYERLLDAVEDAIDAAAIERFNEKLAAGEVPYLVQLPRRPGQKEARYMHLLSGVPEISEDEDVDDPNPRNNSGLESRVEKLEQELAQLQEAFNKLMKELS